MIDVDVRSKTPFSEEEKAVLLETATRMADIAKIKEQRHWSRWQKREVAELRQYGPRYSPSDWFGDGKPIPERYRVKYLRAIHRLEERGMLETTSVGRRLANVKLTEIGVGFAAELAEATADDQADTSTT